MKLIKFEDVIGELNYLVHNDALRSTCFQNLSEFHPIVVDFTKSEKSQVYKGIIWEIEFETKEDLINLIPEEFL